MRTNVALLTKEDGASPTRNPSTDTEDARVASLITLEDIYKQAEVHLFSTSIIFLGCVHQGLYNILLAL